jgi:hypothetical protein
MLDILRLPMTKEILGKMTLEERGLFLLLGYASNQVLALLKLVIMRRTTHPRISPLSNGFAAGRLTFCSRHNRCDARSMVVSRKGLP